MVAAKRKVDRLERLSRLIVLAAFSIALMVAIMAPLLALSFRNLPFPGFMVEQTLVVNDSDGEGWAGREAGIAYPQRVTRIGGEQVSSTREFRRILTDHAAGDNVIILTRLPDGTTKLYPSVQLMVYQAADLLRQFALPYGVGLAYLAIAAWIYLVRGGTRPGRALAYFSICTSLVCMLLFDIATTHAASAIWTVAVAQTGGALISLAMRFPEEWKVLHGRGWLLGVPYGISVALSIQSLLVLYSKANPWAYADAWGRSYRFTAAAILFFLGVMLFRAFRGSQMVVRRQARLVLFGSLLAFVPVTVYFLAPLLGLNIPFNQAYFLPGLLLFPLAVAGGILRYRLWDIDTILNRTLVYGILTAFVAGLFTALIGLSQRLFVLFTGEESDTAIIITTLIVASAITPLKNLLQEFVDRRFKDQPDHTQNLRRFGDQVQSYLEMTDPERLTRRLLEKAALDMGSDSGALYLVQNGQNRLVHTVGVWRGRVMAMLPLEVDGDRLGTLMLGPRLDRRPYDRQDFHSLQGVARQVARAMRLAGRPEQLLDAWRLQQDASLSDNK
jgi:hypothetical protein